MNLLRVYEPAECHPPGERRRGWSPTGYPFAWSEVTVIDTVEQLPIKDLVRTEAGHRCVRCGHPFRVGESGVMDGPSHEAKALGAELGLSSEVLDLGFVMYEADHPGNIDIDRARRTNWSDCDEHCTHGGPWRHSSHLRESGWCEHAKDPTASLQQFIAQGNRVQAAWRILTVHHLNENKADCRWWNLAALCQRCHLEIQGKVNMAQVYPHEHSAWFKPYAAGFYAATYLGEDLTREETLERLDELLALEAAA